MPDDAAIATFSHPDTNAWLPAYRQTAVAHGRGLFKQNLMSRH